MDRYYYSMSSHQIVQKNSRITKIPNFGFLIATRTTWGMSNDYDPQTRWMHKILPFLCTQIYPTCWNNLRFMENRISFDNSCKTEIKINSTHQIEYWKTMWIKRIIRQKHDIIPLITHHVLHITNTYIILRILIGNYNFQYWYHLQKIRWWKKRLTLAVSHYTQEHIGTIFL